MDAKVTFEVTCPRCKSQVKVDAKEAESTMKVRCRCGETIPLVKGLGV